MLVDVHDGFGGYASSMYSLCFLHSIHHESILLLSALLPYLRDEYPKKGLQCWATLPPHAFESSHPSATVRAVNVALGMVR